MFLVIPFVEFLRMLGVDINVHHENPATFLCHVSVSSVKSGRHRFTSSRWHPDLTPGAGETRDTNWVAILGDIPQIPGLLSAIFRLIEAHRNEIQAQPASFAANRSDCSARGSGTRGFASFQAHLCLRRLSQLTPAAVTPERAAPAAGRCAARFLRGMRAQKADQKRHHHRTLRHGGYDRVRTARNASPRRLVAKPLLPYRFAWPQTDA